ncbi:MAG: type II secretion system protein, partial [Clostridia bacterium]
MKEKNNLKNSKGITLIALVVTIVILLILAAISINAVIGENGLITKARDAKAKTEQDAVNTEIALNNLYDEMLGILGENASGSGSSVDLSLLNIGDYINYTYDPVADGYSLLSTQSGYSSNQ